MKLKNTTYPIIKLPSKIQVTLYLIKEELKSRKLFQVLLELGLDGCNFQPNLDPLILQTIGSDEEVDESFSVYNNIMEKRSRKIAGDNDSIMKQAMKAYQELVEVKKGLAGKE